jgi:uncharacterized protein (DUF3084 family)
MSNDPTTVPLTILAQAWSLTPEALAAQLGADAIVTDILRIKHVRVTDACKLLEQRDAEIARHAAADEARNAEMAAQHAAQQARIQAIQRRSLAARVEDPTLSALAVMRGDDRDERLDAASERLDEFLGIGPDDFGTMHRYTPTQEG